MDETGALCPEGDSYYDIVDPLTQKQTYRVYTRWEPTGETDEWGSPASVRKTRLYDTDGNPLTDWQVYQYGQAFSRYVTRCQSDLWIEMPTEETEAALWDPTTGEIVLDQVWQLTPVGNNRFLALSATGQLLGVIDDTCSIVSGFPAPVELYYPAVTETGLIVGNFSNPYDYSEEKSQEYVVLDDTLQERYRAKCEYLSAGYYALRGNYLYQRSDGGAVILSGEDFSPLVSVDGARVEYFDGERMLLSDNTGITLCDSTGHVLAGPFDQVYPADSASWSEQETPAQEFLVKDNTAVRKFDRDGKVLYSYEAENVVDIYCISDGVYSYSVQMPDQSTRTGLLNGTLGVITPADTYESISQLHAWVDQKNVDCDIYQCYHTLPNGVSRCDLLDKEGNVLAKNLSSIGTVSDTAIAVIRGSKVGLLDYKGNWIASHSIYTALEDE